MEASMHRQNWLTLRLLVGLNLQPLPEVSEWARELLLCNHRVVYTGNQPLSSGWAWVLRCFSRAQLFATPWTVPHQAPLSMGILPTARTLEWGAISSSRGSSWPRDRTQVSHVSCTSRQFFTTVPLTFTSVFTGALSTIALADSAAMNTGVHVPSPKRRLTRHRGRLSCERG